MFTLPTVFVLGAGAGEEFGLPLGGVLKQWIAKSVNFTSDPPDADFELREILQEKYSVDKINQTGGYLARIVPRFPSIDEALHFLSDDASAVELGKLAIAKQLLLAERGSHLFVAMTSEANTNQITHCSKSFAYGFLNMAVAGLRRSDIDTVFQNVTIINFNYDRSFEQYLVWSLQRDFSFQLKEAAQIVSGLTVLRPYGSLGSLEWQSGDSSASFGATGVDFLSVASRIRTYTEQAHQPVIERIKAALNAANLIVILGFGFHRQNLELLTVGDLRPRRIFITVRGIPDQNHPHITERVTTTLRSQRGAQTYALTCSQLLQELGPTIMG